jgi:hypothetical protein
MKKSTFLLFLTIFIFSVAFGQFNPNSIGVCYLQQDTSDFYSLTISLPYKTLQHQKVKLDTDFKEVIDTITYIGQITLFDNAGEILRINNKEKFLVQFWCENDGGIQYRPTLKTKVKKTDFKRPLKAINKIQNICCFALVNRSGQNFELANLTTDKTVEMKGDCNGDGKIDCFIWTVLDEAMNCDEKPDNNLEIMLRVGKIDYRLRCCGP